MNGDRQQEQFVSYEPQNTLPGSSSDGTKKGIIIGSIVIVVVGLIVVGIIILRAKVLNTNDVSPAATQDMTAADAQTGDAIRTAPAPSSDRPIVTDPTTTERHTRPNTPAVPADSPDSDGDGISDAAEAAYRTDPHKADTDGDGYGDFAELQEYGTDPLDTDNNPDTTEGRYQPDKQAN